MSCYCQFFQTSSPQKPFGLSKPNVTWSLLWKGNQSFYKWSWSHDQDGRQAHLWLKPLKIFSRTESPMIFKFGMQHGGLRLYKICINGDFGLTLTYFTARSFANLGFSIGKSENNVFFRNYSCLCPKGVIHRQLIELIKLCEYW